MLQILQKEKLYAKLSKCSFGAREIDYLGHTINGSSVSIDKSKLCAVWDWLVPTNLKQLRGFLGLTGYYRKIVKGYASVASPLTDMLKKDSFCWNSKSTEDFEALKKGMTSARILNLPDFKQTFTQETNASGNGVGAVLS